VVPTEVLVTVVLAAFALLGGALYALIHVQGARITDLGTQLGTRITDLGTQLGARIDDQGASLRARIDDQSAALGTRIDDQSASLGGRMDHLSARVSALETRQHADMMEVRGDLGAIRAAIAGIDARLSTIEH
jgi:hypothetical protein